MNEFATIEKCRPIQYSLLQWLWMSLIALPVIMTGCRGTPLTFPQSFSGLGGTSRVPPPATGSYQVPQTYSGPSSNSSGLGSSSFSPQNGTNAFKTSQTIQPVSDVVNGISAAQAQFRSAANNALNSVNRTANDVNSRVENATARVDRFGEGVVQASAILSEAATTPVPNVQPSSPMNASSSLPATTGRIGDATGNAEATTWRTPSGQ